MTDQQLLRGQEIVREIQTLKYAIADVEKSQFLRGYDGCSREGIPFLAELGADVRKTVIFKITQRIAKLEKEFVAL